MVCVVRDEGEAASERRRRDEQVEVLDERACPAESRLGVAEDTGSLGVEAEHDDATDEVVYRRVVGIRMGRASRPVAQFRQRYDRDAHCLRASGPEAFADGLAAPQPEDARVSVQQEVYSAGGSDRDRRPS